MRQFLQRKVFALFPLLGAAALALFAAEVPAGERIDSPESIPDIRAADGRGEAVVAMKTDEVAIFKDGYALVKKTGRGRLNADGELFVDDVPAAAVLGTFWATPGEGRLVGMTADEREFVDQTAEERICQSTAEMVAANIGRECEVTLNAGRERETRLKGRIKELLLPCLGSAATRKAVAEISVPSHAAASMRQIASARPLQTINTFESIAGGNAALLDPEMRRGWRIGGETRIARPVFDFILETDAGEIVLNTADIALLGGRGLNTRIVWESFTPRTGRRLTIRLDGTPGDEREIVLFYFTPGLRWIPTYQLELPGDGAADARAEMRLQGEILNELEDLAGVKASLVVGAPHFRFRDTISPLSLEKQLQNALVDTAPQLMGRGGRGSRGNDMMMSNALMSQATFVNNRRMTEYEEADSDDPGASIAPELSTDSGQDLFFYTVPSLSLRRHARAAITLFSAAVAYREVHTWDVHIRRSHRQSRDDDDERGNPLRLRMNEVWRSIELHNTSGVPWTTGPAFFIQNGRPVGQEMLTYTPSGGKVRCPVAIAVDVRGRWSERETGRALNALKWNDHGYSRVDMEAIFSVRNAKKTPVDVELLVRTGGEANNASPDAEILHGDHNPDNWHGYWYHMSLNKQATALRRFTVPPGEEIAPRLNYHYYWYQ